MQDYKTMLEKAEKLKTMLSHYCGRIEIAGSIRRKKPFPNDIEIVYIPITNKLIELKSVLDSFSEGNFPALYTKIYFMGVKADLFMATKDNWGLIFCIRTGSAEFSHSLAIEWYKQGYYSEKGILHKRGEDFFIREEQDLFYLLGLKFVEPENRI